MKRLTLVRHAKSSRKDSQLTDMDRPFVLPQGSSGNTMDLAHEIQHT